MMQLYHKILSSKEVVFESTDYTIIRGLLDESEKIEDQLRNLSKSEDCYKAFLKSLEHEDRYLSPHCVLLYSTVKKLNVIIWQETNQDTLKLIAQNREEMTSKFIIHILAHPNSLSYDLLVPTNE